jgi:GTP-binding protein
MPNAGKSTLLSVVSNARPKIAAYPFTTLEPNLGVVILEDQELVFADIPGLIEGAHMGVGLGHSFLRHIQRTRLLVHLLDGSSENALADYSQINTELALFDQRLGEKPQIVVFNKIDLPQAQKHLPKVQATLKSQGIEIMPVSAATHQNIPALLNHVFQEMSILPDEIYTEPVTERPVYDLSDDETAFVITREGDTQFRVSGEHIERAAAMTYWDYEEAVDRFQRILETLGISKALEDAGVKTGDTVFIGKYELEWSED